MSTMIGTEIGNYRITDRLGQGGMGVVFKAVDITLDRVVALKVLNPEVAEMPELVQRFRSEARVQAGLSHPNLTTLFALLVWEGRPVMVMEFIEGETFQSMIERRGPIPANVTIPMFRQALMGVGAAHHRGIIHRDIKPANIMLNHDGLVKVMDFGIAKVLGVSGATRTNMQMGTSWYMSPEQIMTNSVDARSDIYSLGVTLYEMLAGQLPLQGNSDYEVQMAHLERAPDPPTIYYPHIPPHIVAATMKALNKRPDQRFSSVEEFIGALDGSVGEVVAPTPIPMPPVPPPSAPPPSAPPPSYQTLAPQTFASRPAPVPPPPPPPVAPQQFTPPPAAGAPLPKWALIGGASAVVLVIAGGLFYSNSLSRQREAERQRIIVQRQEAENRRQAALRQEREEQTKAEEQRTAQELTERVKREQEESQAQADAEARAKAVAAQKAAGQRAATVQQQQGRGPAAAGSPYQRLSGTWRGSYICSQGQTATQLLIEATPQGVTAVLAFAVPNGKPGTFLMNGNFNPANGQLNLQFVRWGVRPPNYLPANLSGTVDLNQGVITGRVLAAGCSTFTIRR